MARSEVALLACSSVITGARSAAPIAAASALALLRCRYHRDRDFYSCWISPSSFDFFSRQ
jgi:hypothetical protein